jgi:acetyl-CoA C-acetyltransferase/acetyl-CoA acyltransferase
MKERIAIVDGIRTPMAKAGTVLKELGTDDLGVVAVRELLKRTQISMSYVDELIFGNVATPAHAANIARVIAMKAGLPVDLPAFTVSRNCASGMESITTAGHKILAGEGKIYIAGGTESMSNIPFFFNRRMKEFYSDLYRARSTVQKIKTLFSFRFSFLKPEIGVVQGLTDPISGKIMGETAEILAKEFNISREKQDIFALSSHQKAVRAIQGGILAREIVPVPEDLISGRVIKDDNGPRENQTMDALSKLKPYFDREKGSVTVGNASSLTDGACALLIMEEKKARELGYIPLGYLREYAYVSLDPDHMGLGPVHATAALLKKSGASMKDFEIIELNEAFAAQVLACEKAFASTEYAKKSFGLDHLVGELDMDILNVNGGAIALGHPVGMSGARLVLHTLKELNRRNLQAGLATLCVGGGQGAALFLEVK